MRLTVGKWYAQGHRVSSKPALEPKNWCLGSLLPSPGGWCDIQIIGSTSNFGVRSLMIHENTWSKYRSHVDIRHSGVGGSINFSPAVVTLREPYFPSPTSCIHSLGTAVFLLWQIESFWFIFSCFGDGQNNPQVKRANKWSYMGSGWRWPSPAHLPIKSHERKPVYRWAFGGRHKTSHFLQKP